MTRSSSTTKTLGLLGWPFTDVKQISSFRLEDYTRQNPHKEMRVFKGELPKPTRSQLPSFS